MFGKTRRIWIIVAAAVAIIAIIAAVWAYLERPVTLTAAVDPNTEDAALLSAVGEQFKRERASVRLQVKELSGSDVIQAAFEGKQANLAVIRGDRTIPIEARAVAVMRTDALLLMARSGSRIQAPADLAGKRIGLVGNDADQSQLTAILSHYNVASSWTTVRIPPEGLANALGQGIDAVAVAGPITGKLMADAVAAFGNRGPVFVPIDQAEALAQRLRVYESIEIPAGMFGGNPAKPGESLKTIGFSDYLLAHSDISEQVIAELARRMFSARRRLAQQYPALTLITAPNTSKDSTVPPHPGAAAYFNDAERSFFDRYGDWVYILAMVASVLGSIAAGLSNYIGNASLRRRGIAKRLSALLKQARGANNTDALARIEAEADKIVGRAMVLIESGKLPADSLASFSLSFDLVRRAVAERRAHLAEREGRASKSVEDT
jgi:TRAP transporter TAXI family solute receptor